MQLLIHARRTALLAAGLLPTLAAAERLADHPAVAVQRLYKQQGYDYASKFYPHPPGCTCVARRRPTTRRAQRRRPA